MTLQASGAISIADLKDMFGGGLSNSLNQYYRGGGIVPDKAENIGIPTTGILSLSDFYGQGPARFSGIAAYSVPTSTARPDGLNGTMSPGSLNGENITQASWSGDSGNIRFSITFENTALPVDFFDSIYFRGYVFNTSSVDIFNNGTWTWEPASGSNLQYGGAYNIDIYL